MVHGIRALSQGIRHWLGLSGVYPHAQHSEDVGHEVVLGSRADLRATMPLGIEPCIGRARAERMQKARPCSVPTCGSRGKGTAL